MLSKLGRALTKNSKYEEGGDSRPVTPTFSPVPNRERHLSVAGAVLSAHPNLSVFHSEGRKSESNDDDKDPHDSDDEDDDHNELAPPPSPTKKLFKTFFKRSSKLALDIHHPSESTSRISLHLPKKVRTKVQANTFEPPPADGRATPVLSRHSNESTPALPRTEPRQTVRSILKTPGGEGKDSDGLSSRRPTVSTFTTPSVRFFSRDAYREDAEEDVSPSQPVHSRQTSKGSLDAMPELGEFPRTSAEVRRTDTIGLLDMLRDDGKVESPNNALTFAASVCQDSFGASADPFSGERDAPSIIPFPAEEGIPRPSIESSRGSVRSGRSAGASSRHRDDSNHFDSVHPTMASRSIEIPPSMSNLLDSYPGEVEEPLLPQISMSDGLYGELHEEMKTSGWMPQAIAELEEQCKSNLFVNSNSVATARQRSITLSHSPTHDFEEDDGTLFHSIAESSPAMSRILRDEANHSPIDFPATDTPSGAVTGFSLLSPSAVAGNITQYFTPRSAPPGNVSFGIDPRRTDSDPPAPATRDTASPSQSNGITAVELFGHEDALISSLRSQLMVQTSLVAHYEAELSASQSLVASLNERIRRTNEAFERYKEDHTKRKDAMSRLKRKVRELESMVEEADGERSQRSMLDECTASAMMVIQQKSHEFEDKYNQECKKRENLESELESLREYLDGFNATQLSMVTDRPDFESQEIEELKSQIEELQAIADERKALELQLEGLRAENEELKDASTPPTDETGRELHNIEVDNLRQIIRETSEELDNLKQKFDGEVLEKNKEIAALNEELESQWKLGEEDENKIQTLRSTLEKREQELDAKHLDFEMVTQDYEDLEARCQELENGWNASEQRRLELEEEVANNLDSTKDVEVERNSLTEQLRNEKKEVGRLSHAVQELQNDLQQLDEERRFAVDDAERLKQNLQNREKEISSDTKKFAAVTREKDELAAELNRLRKENCKLLDAQQRQQDDITSREVDLKRQLEEFAKRQTDDGVSRETLDSKIKLLEDEVERSNKKIVELKSQSADTEFELVDLRKARVKDQEDKEGLEIALQAKQQELDLIKRKLQVRGVTESTPLSKPVSRRESNAPTSFPTPMLPPPRPSSALSTASTARERKEVTPPIRHRASLALSPRNTNTETVEPASVAKKARFTETTTSPPATRRMSISSISNIPAAVKTPVSRPSSRASLASSTSSTPLARKLSVQDTSRPTARATPSRTPRPSSIVSPSARSDASPTKENMAPASVTLRRSRTAVPA